MLLNVTIGAAHLVGGSDNKCGQLEIYHLGRWGTICSDNFGRNEANVVCSMLEFTEAVVSMSTSTPSAAEEHIVSQVICDGTEGHISSCDYDIPHHVPTYQLQGLLSLIIVLHCIC